MRRAGLALFTIAALSLPLVSNGQDTPKNPPKVKGYLPQNWKELGLTEDQKQKVYTINNKYGDEVAKLKSQIKDIEDKRDKERLEILTPEQKKKYEEVMKAKANK